MRFLQSFSQYLPVKYEVDAATGYCACGHVWLTGRLKLLGDGNAPDFLDAAQRARSVAIIAETMTAMIVPSQCSVSERRNTVITSGHPLGFDIGLSLNSPSSTCKSRCAG
jgi:hypothetical protein